MKAVGKTQQERLVNAIALVIRELGWTHGEYETKERRYFAKNGQNDRLWIKARTLRPEGLSWDWTQPDPRYDRFVGIIMAPDGEILAVVQTSRATVDLLKRPDQKTPNKRRLRWDDETKAAVQYLWPHT